jgi:putative ABC transport system ATP-binding protein
MIEFREVEFAYEPSQGSGGGPATPGSFVLRVPQLTIGSGEQVACIGPSGCGKTTLVSLISGVLAPTRGEVKTLGLSMGKVSERRRRAHRLARIGMMFQEFELFEYLTAIENITVARRLAPVASAFPLSARSLLHEAGRLAEATGISHLLHRKPGRLSQGERQRVAICRALVTKPTLILCDEPTGNLDPATASAVLELLLSQATATGATLLMVTHNHDLLSKFGRILDVGRGLWDARNPVRKELPEVNA